MRTLGKWHICGAVIRPQHWHKVQRNSFGRKNIKLLFIYCISGIVFAKRHLLELSNSWTLLRSHNQWYSTRSLIISNQELNVEKSTIWTCSPLETPEKWIKSVVISYETTSHSSLQNKFRIGSPKTMATVSINKEKWSISLISCCSKSSLKHILYTSKLDHHNCGRSWMMQ